jgi:metal-sulfur cluster biosynthetic enzyme
MTGTRKHCPGAEYVPSAWHVTLKEVGPVRSPFVE